MRHLRTTNAGATKTMMASGAMLVAMAGLTGCGDSAGPEAGDVTTEDLTQLQGQVAALEERVADIEKYVGGRPGIDPGAQASDVVGQQVTVSAQVSEVITSGSAGSAFRIAGDAGPSVAVLTGSAPEGLEVDDVVRISGTVQMVTRDSFEQDFGIAEDELFDDPDAFFEENEGQPAIAADRIEVIQEQAEE